MSLVESEALVVRTVEFGEADIVATLVTEQVGKLGAIVRGARKGSRRVGGALEPMHTIAVRLDDKGTDLATLKESRIVRPRSGIVANLDALDAAGIALRWARYLFPPRTPEPRGWRALIELLDALEAEAASAGPAAPRRQLARAGLALLAAVGYGLDLDRCAICGRPCPEGKAACVDATRGGLVCRACGGASGVLGPEVRAVARALVRGEAKNITESHAEAVLGLVDRAMAAHAGFER